MFDNFFGGSEPEVQPEVPQDQPIVPDSQVLNPEVQVPQAQDEIRFFEPGQAPEYHPEPQTESSIVGKTDLG